MTLLERCWYHGHPLGLALRPLSWPFRLLVTLRRYAYRFGLFKSTRLPVPVIVVGNLTVGGSGKTPLVTALVERLRELGYRPGVVTRGYGGRAEHWPQQVRPDSDPVMVGDEAVLLARRCSCPVAAGPRRPEAALALVRHYGCDLIVSDDGLQHYALARDLEIVVVDGVRRFGNGRLLPAGPLREPVSRLAAVDLVVSNGKPERGEYPMRLVEGEAVALADPERRRPLEAFRGEPLHAVAGIGHPERFFAMLRRHGLETIDHPFPDHHPYTPEELEFGDGLGVLMTEKDAVKCARFAAPQLWWVPVRAELEPAFMVRLNTLLKRTHDGQEAA